MSSVHHASDFDSTVTVTSAMPRRVKLSLKRKVSNSIRRNSKLNFEPLETP